MDYLFLKNKMSMNIKNFGGFKSSAILVGLLEDLNDAWVKRKISRIFKKYASGIKNICELKELTLRNRLLGLWLKEYVTYVKKSNFSPEIKRSLRCIMVTCRRQAAGNVK